MIFIFYLGGLCDIVNIINIIFLFLLLLYDKYLSYLDKIACILWNLAKFETALI